MKLNLGLFVITSIVHSGWGGCRTGNRENLSNSQAVPGCCSVSFRFLCGIHSVVWEVLLLPSGARASDATNLPSLRVPDVDTSENPYECLPLDRDTCVFLVELIFWCELTEIHGE